MANFKVGSRVKVRSNLVVGTRYYMNDTFDSEVFTDEMKQFANKESTIVEMDAKFRYKLDIDDTNWYTDEMLIKFVDGMARSKGINPNDEGAIEALLSHVMKKLPEQLINHALDTGNKELFDKLTESGEKMK